MLSSVGALSSSEGTCLVPPTRGEGLQTPLVGEEVREARLPCIDTLRAVETPEGIALMLRPAGVMARSLAYGIDFLLRFAVFVVVVMASGMLGSMGIGLVAIVWFGLEWLYPLVFEFLPRGATPGKRALGLRVVMDSGLPLTLSASVTRNVLRAADYLPMLYGFGLLTVLLRGDSKRLGDVAAGTLVVFAEPVSLHAQVPPLPAQLSPTPPGQALPLAGQKAIVEWAARIAQLTPERAEELATLAQPMLGKPIGIPTYPAAPRLLAVAHWLLGHRGSGHDKHTAAP